MLVGKNASGGIALGRALVLSPQEPTIEEGRALDVDREVRRYRTALEKSKAEISRLHGSVLEKLGADKAQIFEAHLLMIEDPELTDAIENSIRGEHLLATKAVKTAGDQFVSLFQAMDDEYLRERALDVQDVTQRVLRNLQGIESVDLTALTEETVLVAHDITPSQMATLSPKVTGIVTEIGGKTSHTAIMARTLDLPAVVGVKNAAGTIRTGDVVVVDGDHGKIFLNPSDADLRAHEKQREDLALQKKSLRALVGLPSVTRDHRTVHLEANIASPLDLQSVLHNDADGIGLFRTEFIYMDRTAAPSEEEQFQIYRSVVEKLGSKPTVIRTLDVGGDKHLPYLNIPHEENPFLGLRAIRYCLKHPEVFKPQLRALLRASVFGDLWVMFPMISGVDEVLAAKAVLEECRRELTAEGKPFRADLRIGIMIEIPSAALLADVLAAHVDFFSIGTNDLIQYVCAVDRMNEAIHDLYDPFHPAVLRLIRNVIAAGERAGITVAMCGEMASNSKLTGVLLGFGLTHFSMAPASILKIRKKIREASFSEAKVAAERVLALGTGREIEKSLS